MITLLQSFMKTLKSEEVHLWEYRTMEDVQRRIPYFIEDVYNHKRLHSAIGYCPPNEFEFLLESNPNPSQDTLIRLALICAVRGSLHRYQIG